MYYCRHTNYHRASRLYHVHFSPKPEHFAKQLLAADLSYCCLYPSKQAINCFMLFAHLDHVLFSRLKCSVEQVLTADFSARAVGAGRLLIARSMNNITGPTDARTEPGYKLNCIWRVQWVGRETLPQGTVGGARDFAHALTIQFAMF